MKMFIKYYPSVYGTSDLSDLTFTFFLHIFKYFLYLSVFILLLLDQP